MTSSLLKDVCSQKREAWEHLVDVYCPLVYWWCTRAGIDSADVPDIGQEVFLRVSRSADRFRRDQTGHTFRGWLRTITKNEIASYFRRENRRPRALGGSDAQAAIEQVPAVESESVDESLEEAHEIKLLYKRVVELVRGEFSETDWQIFLAYVVQGRVAADVADEIGVSRNRVYLAKSRMLARIKSYMDFDDNH